MARKELRAKEWSRRTSKTNKQVARQALKQGVAAQSEEEGFDEEVQETRFKPKSKTHAI